MTKRKMIDADELLKGLYDERPKDVALYIANFPEASCMNPEKMHDTDDLISRQAAIDAIWHSIGDANGELQSFAEVIVGDAEDEIRALPSVQPEDWMERNKDRILKAGMEGREVEFRIGGRLFAIREKAQ